MFREYALDPTLFSTWRDVRYYIEKFGWEHGRLLARYPKRWKRLVYRSFDGNDDMEKKRVEQTLATADDRWIPRPGARWAGPSDPCQWFANAREEHLRDPFFAIISKRNPEGDDFVLVDANLTEAEEPRWCCPDRLPSRDCGEMADAVSLLLKSADTIVLVDPYFDPTKPRFFRTFEAFIKCALDGRRANGMLTIELHTGVERFFWQGEERTPEKEARAARNLVADCRRKLPHLLPKDAVFSVTVWKQRCPGERLHNRYILTNSGGVLFGIGLDDAGEESAQPISPEGRPSSASAETDDVLRLSAMRRATRWNQYVGSNSAFDLVHREVIQTVGQEDRGD